VTKQQANQFLYQKRSMNLGLCEPPLDGGSLRHLVEVSVDINYKNLERFYSQNSHNQ
jgi:hypothetical protein